MTELDDHSLADAAGATSDYAALQRALERPEAAVALGRKDPLLPARLRGLRAKRELLEAEGGALSVEQVAQLLGITRQAVDKRRRAGKLLALDTGRHGYAYPAWQLTSEGTLPGPEDVLADLGVESPWMRAGFFLGGNVRLGGETPLAELRRGHVDQVRRAARAYGEHGAT